MKTVVIGQRVVGNGRPVFIAAEIGINHNGDVDLAQRLIDAAVDAGCDAVKFQKRTPELCVPEDQRDRLRDTPWGTMTYLDYRRRVEFGETEYRHLIDHCRARGIAWFASCWDEQAVEFIETLDPIAYKVPSAALTHGPMLELLRTKGRPVILSTGMSTMEQIDQAVAHCDLDRLILTHATSTYPCPLPELNLRMIETLRTRYDCPVGYSGHEVGLATTVAAVSLGACFIERHITLDRAMWGTDQAASIEPHGFERLVKDIRNIEAAMGDGVKRVYDSEIPVMAKLRLVDHLTSPA